MIEVKKGQRWLWRGSYASVIVEILENKTGPDATYMYVSGMVLQNVTAKEWSVGSTQNWTFGGELEPNWTYLAGQDAPQK